MPSQGPKSEQKGYIAPAFSGVPSQGDKIKSGYLNPPFSEAHIWAEVLHNHCIRGGPLIGGQNQKWLPYRCLLGGVGGIAMQPLNSRGSTHKGTTSKVAAEPQPPRGTTSGWNCYANPAFSRVRKQGDKNKSANLTRAFSGGPQVGGIATKPLRSPCPRSLVVDGMSVFIP